MKTLVAPLLATLVAAPALAQTQTEQALKAFFEGKTVTVKLDMPATPKGVDVLADNTPAVDYKAYGDRINEYGISIKRGESSTVTRVRVKDKLIEFQLGGGGVPWYERLFIAIAEEFTRERMLERAIMTETDPDKRRQMEEELDSLRRDHEAAAAEEERKARIAQQRLQHGSRFNVRYKSGVPRGITADQVMAALAEFVDFSGSSPPVVASDAPSGPMADERARATVPSLRLSIQLDGTPEGRPVTVKLFIDDMYVGTSTDTMDSSGSVGNRIDFVATPGTHRFRAEFVEDTRFGPFSWACSNTFHVGEGALDYHLDATNFLFIPKVECRIAAK